MNKDLLLTQAYPFQRLAKLIEPLGNIEAKPPIRLTIGEPQHDPARLALEAACTNVSKDLRAYPTTQANQAFREACGNWLNRRFGLSVNADSEVISVNGTREALFAIAQVVTDRSVKDPTVVIPNPFYQIYEGAALLAGARPYYWNVDAQNRGLPNIDSVPNSVWNNCQLVYICSPGNPNGAVADIAYLKRMIALAHEYDFVIVADECYCELYRHEAPPSLLNACLACGDPTFSRCLAFHSLSKRSNLPGLRSGFVAGDASLISAFLKYRTYHGSAMSPLVQRASIAAWSDDEHVAENRKHYNEKFEAVSNILQTLWSPKTPAAGFYLWQNIGDDDEHFVKELYRQQQVLALPGRYLAREDATGSNAGAGYVRFSLVASRTDCVEAAERIVQFLT